MTGRPSGTNDLSFDWDDLRYVLAVARHGSASTAARAMGVAHATVLRRIQSIEQHLGVRVFERLPTGLTLTERGRLLFEAAESIDRTILQTNRRLSGSSIDLQGSLRLTTTDSLMESLVPSLLQTFKKACPDVVVEAVVTNVKLDLDAMDADVALRAAEHPPESWVGRKVARVNFAVYATASCLSRHLHTPWQEMDWLLLDAPISDAPAGRWVARSIDTGRAVSKTNTFVSLRRMCEAGMGVAVLPCFLVTPPTQLQRIAELPDEAFTDLWLLTHEDLRRAPRVRAFMEHAASHLQEHRLLFAGTEG